MLIELDHNLIVSTAQIAEIEELPAPNRLGLKVRVTFNDGRTRVVSRTIDGLRGYIGIVLPAPPGYSVITAVSDGLQTIFWTEAVLAFRYEGQSTGGPMQPITVEGEPSDTSTWALVKPDGEVTDFDRTYESVDAYKVSVAAKPAE